MRINPSFVEYIVFLLLLVFIFDNCCNLCSSERANLVSEFHVILEQQQSDNNFQTLSWFPAKKEGCNEISYKRRAIKLCSFFLSSISQCKIGGKYPIEITKNRSDEIGEKLNCVNFLFFPVKLK